MSNSKPSGWLNMDNLSSKVGATCIVKYIGCLEVKVSMKKLDFKTRSTVAKVCISKVCEAAGLKTVDKKRKIDKKILRAIAETPTLSNAGTDVYLNISSSHLILSSVETGEIIANHDMPRISFASGGDADTMDFVAYIAKDANDWRACYVLECGIGSAKDVISAMGQAFELRYQQYVKPGCTIAQNNQACALGGAEADKDYYNDLPGKMPPDVGPPPVPPLPTVVPPLTTLPSIGSPSLIDLSSEPIVHDPNSPQHNYVNDNVVISKERDIFDMQPFSNHAATANHPRKLDAEQLAELQSEVWYHGQINRAQAEKLLQKDGDFLVRESPNSEGQYVLSGMLDNAKKHLLLIDPDGLVRTKDRMFQSVSHLINYHCENTLPIISAESALVLRTPVCRTNI